MPRGMYLVFVMDGRLFSFSFCLFLPSLALGKRVFWTGGGRRAEGTGKGSITVAWERV